MDTYRVLLEYHEIADKMLGSVLRKRFSTDNEMKDFIITKREKLDPLLPSHEKAILSSLLSVRPFQLLRFWRRPFDNTIVLALLLVSFTLDASNRCLADHIRKLRQEKESFFFYMKTDANSKRHCIKNIILAFDEYLGSDEGRKKVSVLERRFPLEKEDDEKETEWKEQGNISYDPNKILGHGSNSVVYEGRYQHAPGRSIRTAVKCITPNTGRPKSLLDEIAEMARSIEKCRDERSSREIDIFHILGVYNHPNVIRYFGAEIKGNSVYLALDFCEGTLDHYLKNKIRYPELTPKKVLSQIASGIRFLHDVDIIHRDIKPDNILIRKASNRQEAKVVMSDFGLAKHTETQHCSLSGKTGTWGWISPEMYKCLEEMEDQEGCSNYIIHNSTDIFSAGLVFHYLISNGQHPFGTSMKRQSNIGSKRFKLDGIHDADYALKVLVEQMISHDAKDRPTAKDVCRNPYFWDEEKTIVFFKRVSDHLAGLGTVGDDFLQAETKNIIGPNWVAKLSTNLAANLRKKNKDLIGKNSVSAVLRAMRNKGDHYYELAEDVRDELRSSDDVEASYPKEYIRYWMQKFPRLLWFTYLEMKTYKSTPDFKRFYID